MLMSDNGLLMKAAFRKTNDTILIATSSSKIALQLEYKTQSSQIYHKQVIKNCNKEIKRQLLNCCKK